MDKLPRLFKMMEHIPRLPGSITAPELCSLLRGYAYEVDVRTVQRDLDELSSHFPLVMVDDSRPYKWSFSRDISLSLPKMDMPTALAFVQANELLRKAMPGSLLQTIQPYMEAAREILEHAPNPQVKHWSERVRILPDWMPLIPASYCEDVLQTVTDAIFKRRMMSVRYRPRGEKKAKDYYINPQGLIVRSRVIYLIASISKWKDVNQFALHRMEAVEMLDKEGPDTGFSMESYIQAGETEYLLQPKPIKVKLRFSSDAGEHLLETPLSRDMTVEEHQDGYDISATVAYTQQLVWWLLGFGANVEVLAPKPLRQKIANEISALADTYLNAQKPTQKLTRQKSPR